MSEFKVAICDDERIEQLLLSKLLIKYVPEAQRCYFQDGKSLLADFHTGQYQAIFMDIYMRDMNGITVVQEIRRIDAKVPVAFTTSSTDHMADSRMVGATAYLTKPLQEEEVKRFLEKVQEMLHRPEDPGMKLLISGQKTEVPMDQILYFEKKMLAGISLHLKNDKVLKCDKMPEFPMKDFCQCNASQMVFLGSIRQADREEGLLELTDGSSMRIQKSYQHTVLDAYDRYVFDQMRGKS